MWLVERPFFGQHSGVQDARDENVTLHLSIEDDVSLVFDSPQAGTLCDCASHRRRFRKPQTEGFDFIEIEIGLSRAQFVAVYSSID